MFRGKESSNRIELSRLVQELLNFGVLGSLWLWGWGWVGVWGWGVVGGCPPYTCTCMHMHTHTHTRTCMHGKHDNVMQMAAPIGFGEIPGIPYDVIHVHTSMRMHACVCMHASACAHVWGAPPHHPYPHPLTPQGGTLGISQNSIALELIEIFQFRLKI